MRNGKLGVLVGAVAGLTLTACSDIYGEGPGMGQQAFALTALGNAGELPVELSALHLVEQLGAPSPGAPPEAAGERPAGSIGSGSGCGGEGGGPGGHGGRRGRGPGQPRGPDLLALAGRCDQAPELTEAELCATTYEASAAFSWEACTPPGPGRGGRVGGAMGAGGAEPFVPPTSSGSLHVETTLAEGELGCGGALSVSTTKSFSIELRGGRGDEQLVGSTALTSSTPVEGQLPPGATLDLDVAASRTAPDGESGSLALAGTVEVRFEAAAAGTARILSGTLAATFADGTTGTIELRDVTSIRESCPAPSAGSVIRTGADGVAHELVFGPECGEATLDGVALSQRGQGGRHGGGRHGGGRGPGGGGGRGPGGGGGRGPGGR